MASGRVANAWCAAEGRIRCGADFCTRFSDVACVTCAGEVLLTLFCTIVAGFQAASHRGCMDVHLLVNGCELGFCISIAFD